MNEVARLFGQGATYDAVEGQLRKAKKAAAALKEEAAGRSGPAVTPSRSKKTKTVNSSPVKTRELLKLPTTAVFTDCLSSRQGRACVQAKEGYHTKGHKKLAQEHSILFDAAVNGTGSEEVDEEV